MVATRYLGVAETAKIIRTELRSHFPGIVFSVRSKTYAGGSSITIGWTDGPTTKTVDDVVGLFSSSGFDGSIDLAYTIDRYVLDGKIVGTRTSGSAGSGGYVAAVDDAVPGAELVSFGSDYVFTSRERSNARIGAIRDVLATRFGRTDPELWTIPQYLVDKAEAILDETPAERTAREAEKLAVL